MKTVELRANAWRTSADFIKALKRAIGAPDAHGDGIDAFVDSMLYHDDMNALKAPYTIVISGLNNAGSEVQTYARKMVEVISQYGEPDWGTDLEIRMRIED